MYNVILICEDCTKSFQMEKEMLFELIESIAINGKETIQTESNVYIVKGVLFGDVKEQIIFT
ncbi:hypothetical protein [Priestia aryabhattai]|uniref:hypothetical protein n=1 Tax=Priestia aryabhattai TaxID=412384 RepID=UPI0015F60034|nr:hypothetical protein [Priestia aryabhattai]